MLLFKESLSLRKLQAQEEEDEEDEEEEEGIMNVKVKVYELKVFPVSCFVFM